MTTTMKWRLMHELKVAAEVGDVSWIPYLPVPGDYKHPTYGNIVITEGRNKRFMDNFRSAVYQSELPVDAEHSTKLSGAFGYVTDMRQNDDGSVDAKVRWTDRGKAAMSEERFKYFSPEWWDEWQDPMSQETYRDVAVGGALTTRPFFKEKALRPLFATEGALEIRMGDKSSPIRFTKEEPSMAKKDQDTKDTKKAGFVSAFKKALGLGDDVPDDDVIAQAREAFGAAESGDDGKSDAGDGKPAGSVDDGAPASATEGTNGEGSQELTPRQMAERIEAAERRAENAEKKAVELENQARRKRFTEVVQGRKVDKDGKESKGPHWFGERKEHVEMLESLAEKFGEDSPEFTRYVAMNETHAAQVHKAGLMSETGSTEGESVQDIETQIATEAEELRKENPEWSRAKAMSEAWRQNPDLKKEHRKRLRSRQ